MDELLTVLTAIGIASAAGAVLIPLLSGDASERRAQQEANLADQLGATRS